MLEIDMLQIDSKIFKRKDLRKVYVDVAGYVNLVSLIVRTIYE